MAAHCVSPVHRRQRQAITEIDSRVRTAIWGLDLQQSISRDEAIPATLSCPGTVVTVIERRCIYKVPCSATPLIPVNLRRELREKMSQPKDATRSQPRRCKAGNWGFSVSQNAFPAITPFSHQLE